MERQSTSKLYRALIAVVAFFVLCTSAILFASCGTDPRECKHEHLDDSDVVAYELATCSEPGTVTYKCTDCGAEVTKIGTLATGEHDFDANGKCKVCGLNSANDGVTLKEIKDLLVNVATKDLLSTVATQEDLDELRGSIVSALKEKNFTIPALDEKLEAILESVQGLGDLEIEGFDPSDFEGILAGTIAESGKVTLADVITALYNQVHRLYVDYSSTSADSLYNLLVGKDAEGAAHVHNWILKLKEDSVQDCSKGVTYEWGCAFCDETKEGEVKVKAIAHATDYKYGLIDGTLNPKQEAVDGGHYYAATCIAPARVEGHCAVCGQWTGEWNPVGEPTYQHHYVLEEGEGGHNNSCTVSSQNVYHCATCGGAYVEEVKAPGHEYYYKLDKDGNKVKLEASEKEQLLQDYFGEDQDLSLLTEEQKAEALQPYLNIVYSAEATCVDPGLVVVECVECGVRYSYTTGQEPTGHSIVAGKQVNNSCIKDGIAGYAYCYKCGYFFFFDAELEDKCFTVPGSSASSEGNSYYESKDYVGKSDTNKPFADAIGGWYSRNYIRKDGKVLHYVLPETLANPERYLPKAEPQNEDETVDPTLAALYEVTSEALPAAGHSYVPVYTNIANCVTSQKYILVCEKCFNVEKGIEKTDFAGLCEVYIRTAAGAPYNAQEENEDALFYVYKTGAAGKETVDYYTLADLPANNVLTASVNAVKTKVATIVSSMDPDTAEPENEEDEVKKSDLTVDWEAAVKGGHDTLVKFFVDHQGYLNRDAADDEQYTHGNSKDAKAKLTAQLDALSDDELKALFVPYNVVVEENTEAEEETDPKWVAKEFANPAAGHKFTEKVVTVVGGCTLYERHVTICTECDVTVVHPDGADLSSGVKYPATVTGMTDVEVAGYDPDDLPEGAKTDLQKEWEAVVASMGSVGGGLLDEDEDAPTVNWNTEGAFLYVFPWLVQHGYLNEYRDGQLNKAPDDDEINRISQRISASYMAAFGEAMEGDVSTFNPSKFEEDFWTKFYTQQNVLDEFKVTTKYGTVTNGEGDQAMVDANDTEVVLGHKFDNVMFVGVGETCDAPASYVYVCSVCGEVKEEAKNSLTFNSGAESVTVPYVKKVDGSIFALKADADVLEASVMEDRLEDDLEIDDLEAEFTALAAADQFDWLLAKGYLNGVIDSMMLYGYEDEDEEHVEGALEAAVKTADKSESGWLGKLFANKTNKTGIYYDFYDVVETKDKDGKVTSTTVTLKESKKADVKAAAEAIALAGGYGTSTADLTKFYTQSGDGYDAKGEELATVELAANKTSEIADVNIPESGHLWLDGKGKAFYEGDDPACVGFKSDELTVLFNQHVYPHWVKPIKNEDGSVTPGYWEAAKDEDENELKFDTLVNGIAVPEKMEDATTDLQRFLFNAQNYGVIAACSRNEKCPLWNDATKVTPTQGFGYYVAINHVASYEKFAANGTTGFPTAEVEIKGGEHVYYNMKTMEDYRNQKDAAQYLEKGSTWEALETQAATGDTAQKAKANEALDKAAQAAMDNDVHNLTTLQHIWNSLFVDRNWRYPKDAKGNIDFVTANNNALSRDAAYPVYAPAMTGAETVYVVNADGKYLDKDNHVTTNKNEAQKFTTYTGVDYDKIIALFSEGDNREVTKLWNENTLTAESTSAWRPLNDELSASCWVDFRCKWYHYDGGTKCDNGSPKRNHTYPTASFQYAYGYETHLGNCRHSDLCLTCGWAIGTSGYHNDVVVLSKDETPKEYQDAWVAILTAAKATTKLGTSPTDETKFLYAVYLAVDFDKDVETLTWDSGWSVKKDSCYKQAQDPTYTGKSTDATEEIGYEIRMCSGELEAITQNLADKFDWNKGIELKYCDRTGSTKTEFDNKTHNCVVEASNTAKHSWELEGDKKNSIVKYFYLGKYTDEETGDVFGGADEQIWVDKTTGAIVKEGAANGAKLTDDLIKSNFNGVNPLEYSVLSCTSGWYSREFCTNKRADGKTDCGCYNTTTDGKSVEEYGHEADGHHYAPIENYWVIEYTETNLPGYKAPDGTGKNAYLWHVCTTCGMHMQNFYGENKGSDGREQFKISSGSEVEAWNNHIKGLEGKIEDHDGLVRAQTIRPEDVLDGKTLESTTKLNTADGVYVYSNGGTITLDKRATTGTAIATNVIGEGKDVTFIVGKDKTLTFAVDSSATNRDEKSITINGTLAIVGEEGSKVDFSALGGSDSAAINVVGGNLILKNIEVVFNGESGNEYGAINPGSGAVELKNVVIKSTGSALMMSAKDDGLGTARVTIDDSTLISTGEKDFGLGVWKKTVELTATNSTFVGAAGGAFIRSGNATFTDCTFVTKTSGEDAASNWGNGTSAPSHAALVVGDASESVNTEGVSNYGDAVVTLNNCAFGTVATTSTYTKGATLTACRGTDFAIQVFASAVTTTKVTIDAKTYVGNTTEGEFTHSGIPAGMISAPDVMVEEPVDPEKPDGDKHKVNHVTVIVPEVKATDLGATAADQADAAATLVEGVLASGGDVKLPKITNDKGELVPLDFTEETTTNPLTVGAGKSASVNLGGNVVNVKTTDSPNGIHGDLTITNGTITSEGSEKLDFSVQQGGSLTLDGVAANVKGVGLAGNADATNETEAELIIKNHSTIIGIGQVVCTNNVQTKSGKITIENSQIIAKGDNAHDATALLVNNSGVTVEATGTTFYGLSNAVWVRASKAATFTDCTFISGGVNTTRGAGWNGGNEIDPSAMAALVVGDQHTTRYGDASVRITGDSSVVRGYYEYDAETETTKKGTTITFAADGSLKTYGEATSNAKTKRFVVASDEDSTSVVFETEALANKFFASTTLYGVGEGGKDVVISGLEKGKTAYYNDENGNIHVSYIKTPAGENENGEKVEEVTTPIEVTISVEGTTKEAIETNAKSALKDAVKSGGKVRVPAASDGNGTTINITESFAVDEGKDVKIELNAKDVLKFTQKATVGANGGLTITGGRVDGNIAAGGTSVTEGKVGGKITLSGVEVNGQVEALGGATLEINNSVLNAPEGYAGLFIGADDETNGTDGLLKKVVNVTNSTITSGADKDGTGLFINAWADGVTTHGGENNPSLVELNLTNCNILGADVGLGVMAGTVNVTGGTIYGGRVAALVRGGKVSFTDTKFVVGEETEAETWNWDTWQSGAQIGAKLEGALVITGCGGDYGDTTEVTTSGCQYSEVAVSANTNIMGENGLATTSGNGMSQIGTSGYYALFKSSNLKKPAVVLGVVDQNDIVLEGDLATATYTVGETVFHYTDNKTQPDEEMTPDTFKGKISGGKIVAPTPAQP